jgi:hypothetical protein
LEATDGPVFRGMPSIPFVLHNQELVVLASAQVDKDWADAPENVAPLNHPPQSHIVNVRTNSEWFHESAGKKIRGRLDWYSQPVKIIAIPSIAGESPSRSPIQSVSLASSIVYPTTTNIPVSSINGSASPTSEYPTMINMPSESPNLTTIAFGHVLVILITLITIF